MIIPFPSLFDDKVDSVNNPLPAINKVVADDMNGLKQGLEYYYNAMGWESHFSTTQTSLATAQIISPNVYTTIPIVDSAPVIDQRPLEASVPMWNGTQIIPIKQGDGVIVRIDFDAQSSANDSSFEIAVNIGGGLGRIFRRINSFPRGANVTHSFSFTNFFYQGATFVANGGTLEINPSATMTIFNKRMTIMRFYKGR